MLRGVWVYSANNLARFSMGGPLWNLFAKRVQAGTGQWGLRNLCFAASYCLNGLEPLELRMTEVERLVIAGSSVRGTEGVRFGPRFKAGTVSPHRM